MRSSARNIRWVARLGTYTYGSPVIAGGSVFCGTNNGAGWLKARPATIDAGCLLCFRRGDGAFQWQLSCDKLAAGDDFDFREVGVCSAPLVEGDRLWVVTNRGEIVCVDLGRCLPRQEAVVVWRLDMIGQLGVAPHNMSSCSLTAAGDLLLVVTGNGVDSRHRRVPAPQAPSFLAVDKRSGKVAWADSSPGQNILHGQWASPAFAQIGGVPQAIFPGGDGWLYGFFRLTPAEKPSLLWKFDCNPKRSVWKPEGEGDRGILVAAPMVHGESVYIATGKDPEFGGAAGRLWRIDARKRGDTSAELAFDKLGRPLPPRRIQAADPAAGDVVRANPNSAAVWQYVGDQGPKADFKTVMHRTLGMAAIQGDLLVVADLAGVVHCLAVASGKVHWTFDMMSPVWGSPLLADGKIFVGDEDGDVRVFRLSPRLELLAENSMGGPVQTTPAAVDGVLYIATRNRLFAIGKKTGD